MRAARRSIRSVLSYELSLWAHIRYAVVQSISVSASLRNNATPYVPVIVLMLAVLP